MKVGQLPPLSLPFTAAFCSIPTLILLQKLNAHLKSRICSLLLSFLTPPRVSTLAVSWALQPQPQPQPPSMTTSHNHFFPISEEQIQLGITLAAPSSACSKKPSLFLVLLHHSEQCSYLVPIARHPLLYTPACHLLPDHGS